MAKTNPSQPKRTIAEVDTDLTSFKGTVASNFAGVHERIDSKADKSEIERKFAEHRHLINEMERKGEGITLANARAARNESEYASIVKRLEKIEQIKGEGTPLDPSQLAAFQQETKRLDARLEALFERTSGDIAEIREELDTLTARVDEHDVVIKDVVPRVKRLTGRIHNVETDVATLKRSQGPSKGAVAIVVVVALIIAIIVWNIWHSTTFQSSYPMPSGDPVVYSDWRNEWQNAWIAAILAFGLSMLIGSIILAFVGKRTQSPDRAPAYEADYPQQHSVAVPQNPTPVTEGVRPNDTAPTKLLPAASGASHGAR